VAGFASFRGGLTSGNHRRRKIPVMRILVAAHACRVAKMELPVVRTAAFLVAILARHGGMRALQGKAGSLMIPNAESGRVKAVHRVAALAPVGPWSSGELPSMRILVAVEAGLELRAIVDTGNCRRVALRAGQPLVFAGDRVGGSLVTSRGERRWLPTRECVARAAVAAVGAVQKLALVLVLVAIQASLVRYRGLEIRVLMALQASHLAMLSIQREFRGGVVESVRSLYLLPYVGVVTALASRRKGAPVGILVAWGARRERQTGVLDHLGVARRRSMAFGALRVLVFTGQGKVRGGVIERVQRFPAGDGVALLAVRAQLPGMWIGMASLTSRMESFESPVQVADLNLPAVGL